MFFLFLFSYVWMGDEIKIIVRVLRMKEREEMKGEVVAGRKRGAKGRRKGGKKGRESRRERMKKTSPVLKLRAVWSQPGLCTFVQVVPSQ